MSSQLDIIGSIIIAGMIILNFSFFMGERTESQIESTNKITAQTDISDVTETLRFDLRKAGYGCDTLPILRATENSLVFRADLENDGKIDTIGYYFGTASTLISEKSGSLLYRVVNGRKQQGQDLGLEGFRFIYFSTNSYGTLSQTTTLGDIKAIGVSLRLRSKMKVDGECQYSLNEFTISPKNL
ncbi:MAG: hypothetical protein IH600_12205 [Bacteroidetes bacterium]|nr:hypothetical protein [Bacteroidota bacterium]